MLAATAAIVLAAGSAPSLANTGTSTNTFEQCPNILANPEGYPGSVVAYCGGHERMTHRFRAIRTVPAMRDNGPSIALPG
jgi:hypothetical protein